MISKLNRKFTAATVAFVTFIMAVSASAIPIALTPTSATLVASGNQSSMATIESLIQSGFGPLDVLYKASQDSAGVAGPEVGDFAGSYNTVFANADLANADARIKYDGAPDAAIISSPVYALIKDGNLGWYLFDISGWNGTDNVEFSGFYDGNQGKISHVSLYGNAAPPSVPDGGATIAMFGMALSGLGYLRRKLS